MALNRIYKVVWSKTKGCYVVVSELAKRVGRNKAKAIVISSAAMAMAVSPVLISTVGATLNQPGTGDGNGVAWGENSTGTGSSAVAIGRDANASAYQSVAIGKGAISSNNSTVALGQDARATASGASALSVAATASGNNAVAIAYNSNASGTRATAIGEESNASSEDGIALGYKTRATSGSAVAIGREVVSSGDSAVALGKLSKATGRGSLALATEANATGNDSYAIGWRSDASAESTMAFGHSSKAKKNYDIAFGRGAEARDQGSGHSIAIGYGASAASNRGGLDSNTTSTGTLNSAGGVAIGTGAYTGINRGDTAINSSVAVGAGAGAGYRGLGADGLPTGNGTDPDDNATVLVKAFGGTTSTVDYFKNTGSANGDGFFSYQNVDINEATALGRNTRAIGDQSVAIGAQSIAGQGSIVIGGNDIQAYDGKKYFKAANPTSGAATTVNDFNAETTPGTGKNDQPITISAKYAELVGAALDNSYRASYGQDGSTVIGMQAHSTTPLGVAIGTNSIVRKGAFGATAIGSGASVLANAEAAVAIGMGSEAQGNYAVAAGTAARAKESAVAAGYKADAGVSAVSVGDESKAVQSSVAVGQLAQSLQVADIAIGQGAIAKGEQGAIAVGLGTQAQGDSSIMIGGSEITKVAAQPVEYQKEKKDKDGHTVIKTTTKVEHIGGEDVNRTIRSVEMEGANGTIQDAYGELTNGATLDTKTLNYSLPVNKNGHGSISMGIHSLSTGDLGTAIGTGARVTKLGGVALGTGAISELQNGVAIGTGSKADASSIGTRQTDISYDKEGKIVPFDSKKVAYTFYWAGGTNTSEGDVVSFGTPGAERQLKNVAAGRIADDSTDAINGSQLNSVTKRMSSGWAVEAEKDKDSSGVLKLNGAVATAGTEVYSEDGKTTDRVNKGTATGQVDKVRLNDEVKFRVGDNLVLHQQDGSRPVYEDPDNPNRKTGARVTSKFTYSLNPELTNLKSATFKNDAGDTTVINGNGVTVTPVTAGKEPVSLTTTGLNNGGNAISNVASNLPSTKNSDTTTGPSNATTSQDVPNTTNKDGNNYVSPNNAATVGDVLNTGWNLQGNNTAVDFVKPYDTVNFIDGEGTTATVATTDGKTSTVKYSVNLGEGLKKDDNNNITVKAADKSLTVDTNGVKVNPADKSLEVTDAGLKVKTDGTTITTDNTNGLKVVTGEIESVTTGANPGTVKVKDNDAGKIATVDSVVNAVNSAAFTLKASASGGTRNTGSSVTEAGESIKAGSTVEMIAGKNLDVKHDTSGKITFATVDTPSFTTVQVGGDEGPKFSATTNGNISVSDKDGTNPVKITNVKDGDISAASKDAINGSQFHGLAKNTIKLAGQNGTNAATETNGQNLDQTGGIKFTIKSSDGTLLDVAASGDTITLTPKTATLTTGDDGVPTANTTGGKLVTADQLVTALTEMGWKATAGKDGTGTVTGTASELIKAGETVTFKAGDNLAIKQDGKNFIYSLKTELTGLTSGEFKNTAGDKTVINGDGVTITPVTNGKSPVSLTNTGLNNGGNAISNVASNLPSTKNSDVTTGPSNATTSQEAPNTTNKDGNNYVSPNNAATVGDVLNTGWNLQGNNTAVDFVKPYDTVNFIDGEGTTATVATTDGKTSTVKYSVNLGEGLKKDDNNNITVKAADKSLTVDTNGVKVNPADKSLEVTDAGLKVKTDGTTITTDNTNGLKVVTGEIESVTTGANPGTVKVKDNDAGKIATVDSVVNAVNSAAFTLKASASGGTRNTGSSVTEAGESIKAGSTVEMIAGKNLDVKHDTNGKITFATVDTPSFTTVQVGGDEGPKFSKTADGNISVSDKDGTNPVKITNVKDGDISADSKDAINGSQFHGLAKNTIKLAGQNGTNAATETNGQNLDQTGGIKFTIKSSDGTLLDVAASGDTITLTPKTATLTTGDDGVPTANTTGGKLVTADQLVTALTEMGWKATAGKDGTGTVTGTASELIKAGETVTFKAGDNLAIKQDGKNFIYSLKTELTGLTSGEFKNTAGDKTVINGDGVTITPVTNGKSPVSLTTNGLNNGGNPITNVTSNLVNYNDPDVNGVQPAKNSLRNLDNNAVPDTNAATVGDLRNMGWIVSSDKTTGSLDKAYTETVKHANEVKFVGEGSVIVSGNTDDKGVRTITVKVDNQTATNNAITPISYTKADGTKVYPKEVTNEDGTKTIKFYPNPDGTGTEVPNSEVITSINGPKGTKSPTTLSNVAGNLDGAKAGTDAPTTKHEAPNTTEATGPNYVNPNNAATVGDVLQAGWNLQNNGTEKDFVKPYDTVNFINGDGTTATVESTDGKTSTVKYSVNLGNGLQKDDTGNTISVKPADSSLVVDGNGVKVNTGTINNVTTGDKPGTVTPNTGDDTKLATVTTVVNAINNAAWTATSAATAAGELGANATNQLVKAGDKVTFEADKNIKITQNAGKFTFATKDNVSFETVQVGGDQGPKFSKTDAGDIKVSGPNDTDPVKITNVQDGEVSSTSKDAINGSQFHGLAKNTIKLAGQNGTNAATETNGQNLDQTGGIKFTIKSSDGTLLDVAASGDTITLTPKTGTITTGTDGVPTANTTGGKLVTADQLVTALTEMGWKATAGNDGTGTVTGAASELIKAGETVTFKAGDNLAIKQDGKNFIYSLKTELTGLTSAEFKDAKNNKVNITPEGITITKPADPTAGTPENTVTLNQNGLNNGGNTISNVKSNLPDTKNSDTANTEAAPSNATKVQAVPNTTNTTGDNYVNPNNAATVSDVLNAGWNLQGNGQAVDFVKAYDTVNFINGDGTTAIVESTDGKTSTVKYSVNLGNGLQKDDTGNTISVKPADSSLVVDGNGVKVNTGTINNVTIGDKPGTVEANTGDENKVATVGNVVNAINNAAWTATSAATSAGELGATAADQLVKSGDKVTFEADKNIKITQNAGKFTFATKDNVSFETVQVGGDQGPKFSKTDAGDIKVSGPNDTDPVKITNVQDGEVSSTSKDAINGSQFHAVAKNTIKLAGQNGTDTATETNGQNLDQTGGIKFTIKSSDGTLLDVAASGDTITLTPKTGTITTGTDGVPTANTTGGKLVTADQLVTALTEMGWKATAGNDGTGTVTGAASELIKAGETVTFKAGDNLAIKQDGKNFIYSLKTELTGLTSGEFKNTAGDKTVINGDGVTITPVTNGKSPVSLTTNGLNNGGNPITNVTSNLVNYNDPDVNGVQPAKNSLRNLDNNAVPDTNAATVGDLRNMGWIVSSDKKTDDLTKDYSDTVKNANEVKFVGAGTAIVSGKTDDKGVRTITVKVDDQTSTNNAVTPVVYTDKDGNQVYPTGKKDAAGNQIFNTKPDGSGDTVTGPVKTTINGPKGTDSPTTLSNVEGNLDGAKTNTTAPTTNHAGVDTTNPTAANYVNPHNAATVGDVLQAGWNLQGNGTAKDFVRPYDTVNFINGDGTTATVESTDGKTSTVKYSVNLGNGLQKDDTGNTISVKPADSSLVVDGNGVKVNTGTINNVTEGNTAGTVAAKTGDENKIATVGNVVSAINNAAWTATSAATEAGELGATAANQLVKAGDTVTFEADKNIKITQNAGKFTFATKDNVSFETVQVGGDQGPKLSKTDDGDLKVSGPNGTDPVKVTNVKSGLNKYGDTVDGNPVAGTTTANTGLIDLSKPATGEPKVSDNTAATVGDLRNMGWIVSSDKKTDDLTKGYSDTVKNANEVKFVGEGTAIVSGKTDDKGVRTITVKVDDQTSTNNSVTPVNYTKKDGTKVYPKMVKNPDTGTEELKFFEKPDGSGNEVQKGDVITSINGPEGTTKPTTLSNVEGNLDGAKTGTTAPTTNAAAPTLGTANNQLNPHNAATVGDVLQAGWNLQNNGEARDFVKSYDTVNFINGLGTTAVVTTHEGNTTSDVTFNVKAANRSVTVDEDGVKVTTGEMKPAVDANNKETGAIATPADLATAKQLKDTLDAAVKELATAKDALKTAETALAANPTDPALQKAVEDKKADVAAKQTPVTEAQKAHDEAGLNKVATVQNVAEAINNAGFNLKTSADGGEKLTTGTKNDGELIRPSNTVEMVAGNNLTVKQDANGKITYATKDNVTFTHVDTSTLNVGSPNTYTDGKGNTYTKVGDKYYNPTDVVNGAPKQDATPVTIPADVVVKPVSPVTMKTEAAKPATNNEENNQPSSALNITSQDGKPTQITGVGSTLNTKSVDTAPTGTVPGTTPNTTSVNLIDLEGTANTPVNKNAAATVGDLQNMGWVVSAKDGNGYKDVVKNANVVDFKGAQGVTVTGTTLADGTREITIGVATGDVTNKVTITHADGTKTEAVKIGDNYYKVDENGKPVGFEKDKDGKPAGTPLTINPTTDSVTNKGAGFVTGNTVANAIQDSGWNIGKANGSDVVKSDGTAVDFNKEAKVYDKVNPNDDVKFVDGANTNVSMVTVDALNEDGTKKATTFVKVDINRDLKIDSVTTGGTAVDKNGNNLVKVGEKYYKEGDVTVVTNPDGSSTVTPKKDTKPVPSEDVIPPKDGAMIVKNADGKDVVSATVGKDGSGVFAVNGKDGKDGVSITAKDGQGAIGVNGKDGNNTSITGENISIKDKDNNSTSIGINNVTLKDKDGNISTLTADKSELKDKAGNTNTNTSTANILKDPNGNTNTSTASTSELKDKNGNTNTSTPTTNVLKDTNGNTNTSTAGGTTYTDKDANKTVVGPKEIAITDKSGDNKASLTNKDLILNAKDPKTGVDKTSHVSGDKIAFTTTDEIEKVVDKDGKPVIDPTTGKQKEVIKNPGNSTEYTNEGLKVIPNSIVARDANGNLTFLDKDGKPVSKDTDGHYKYVGQDGKPDEKYTGAVGSLKPNVADSTRIISFGMDKPVLDSNGNPVKGPDGKPVMTEGISAGMQQIHNVAPGTKDTDAVNVSQLRGTTININNRVNRMGAQAAALAGLQSIQYDPLEPTQISAGVGYYQGASALALGMNHYKNESTMFHVGASVNGNMNEVMANASVTWKFGARADETAVKDTFRQGPISASYTLQDKVSALEAQNRVQKEQLETLKALNEKQQEQIAELFKRLSEKA